MAKSPFLIGALMLATGVGAPAAAQVYPEENGRALAGVAEFDAIVTMRDWLSLRDDGDMVRDIAQTGFELGLKRDGVRISRGAPNVLRCLVSAVGTSDAVAYRIDVQYYRLGPDVHELIWTNGTMATADLEGFRDQGLGQRCVDAFSAEWLRRNPKG